MTKDAPAPLANDGRSTSRFSMPALPVPPEASILPASEPRIEINVSIVINE